MSSRSVIVIGVLALAAGVWLFYELAAWTSRGGPAVPLYSTRRYDAYGAAALAELLQRRGNALRLLHQPRFRASDRGTLIQILPLPEQAPLFGPEHKVPADRLIDWMRNGNTVVQYTRRRTDLMDELDAPSSPILFADPLARRIQEHQIEGGPPDERPGEVISADWRPPRTEDADAIGPPDAPPLEMLAPRSFGTDSVPPWRPLAWTADRIVAVWRPVGDGRLILIGAPTPALNDGLDRGGNLDLLLGIVGDEPVLIDEWSHGIGSGGTVVQLIRRAGLLPVLAQIVFVLALYHWSTRGHRRIDRAEPQRRRSSLEQIDTLAHLYRRSLSIDQTRSRIVAEVRRRLADALRCDDDQLEDRARRLPAERREQALALLAAVRDTPPRPARRSAASSEADLARLLTRSARLVELLARERRNR